MRPAEEQPFSLQSTNDGTSIINYSRCDDRHNVGDAHSSPLRYFDFGRPVLYRDILTVAASSVFSDPRQPVIVGGGGLFFPRWTEKIRRLTERCIGPLIVWGAGVNEHHKVTSALPEYLRRFNLVGIRDFGLGYEWVPCASCMHHGFDKPRTIKHEIVVYSHHCHLLPLREFPSLANNSMDLVTVLDFLGSADVILTNTYHGAYWGILLGRKVIAFPFSSRFHYLKYKIPLCSWQTWRDFVRHARTFPGALAECRAANIRFGGRVRSLLCTI